MDDHATVRIIGRSVPAAPDRLRAELLRWNVAPENIPYALHAGVQPELIPVGEVVECRTLGKSPEIDRGDLACAVRRGNEWFITSVLSG